MRARHILAAVVVSIGALTGPMAVAASAAEGFKSHAEEECAHILEGGGTVDECQEAPNPILPEPSEIFWGGLSFLILFGVLYKLAFPAVQKAMQARTDKIRENLDEADRVKAEAQSVLDDYQRQLADARNESNRIIEEARQTADQLRRDLMQRAEAEVQELKTRTAADIEAAKDRAMADLQGKVASLAVDLAEKVVERNLDRASNMQLVESYISQLGSSR